MAYEPAIKDETVDPAAFQSDYKAWLATLGPLPSVVELEVEHISKRFQTDQSMTPAQQAAVDNMHMAYDETKLGLDGQSLNVVRVQYGVPWDFDPTPKTKFPQYIELPTSLAGLPHNLDTNEGFSVQYNPQHSCDSARMRAASNATGRILRYTEMCDAKTNLL